VCAEGARGRNQVGNFIKDRSSFSVTLSLLGRHVKPRVHDLRATALAPGAAAAASRIVTGTLPPPWVAHRRRVPRRGPRWGEPQGAPAVHHRLDARATQCRGL